MKKAANKRGRKLSKEEKKTFELLQKGRERYEEYMRRNAYLYLTLLKRKKVIYEPPSFDNPLTTHTIKPKNRR